VERVETGEDSVIIYGAIAGRYLSRFIPYQLEIKDLPQDKLRKFS